MRGQAGLGRCPRGVTGAAGSQEAACPHPLQAERPQQRVLGLLDLWCDGMTLPCSEGCMEDFERREQAAMRDGNPGGQLLVWKLGGGSLPVRVGFLPRGGPW